MNTSFFDLVVIGSGPSGESAAFNAVKSGLSVAVIESKAYVGGSCTHLGTIPSKALRHAVRKVIQFRNNPLIDSLVAYKNHPFSDVLGKARDVISKQVYSKSVAYSRNKVTVFHGIGSFVDDDTVVVVDESSNQIVARLKSKHILIATGSRPYRPIDINFKNPRIMDSDTVLSMDFPINSIAIYGAGVIGCEYASIFSGLGISVELIDTGDRILGFLDHEISDSLSYHFRDNGVIVRHNERYEKVEGDDRSVTTHLKSGKKIKTDAFLFCNGRSGNVEHLALEAIGIVPNERGHIRVDHNYETCVPNVYAAGDVIGWPSLASAAYQQGMVASSAMMNKWKELPPEQIPTGIYTIPEISSIGATEEQLTARKQPYEVGRSFFSELARAQISDEMTGMLKILFCPKTLKVLGVHCFGYQASEIIHIGQILMQQEGDANTLMYFVNTTFNYPTMAEAYRIAALNGLNRIDSSGVVER